MKKQGDRNKLTFIFMCPSESVAPYSIIFCDPYYFDLNELLLPIQFKVEEFVDKWNR